MSSIDIELVSVSKSFGAISVVKDISLQIPQGEFVSILGPSGCGKTTTLNMIAGFNQPSFGDIRIRGRSQGRVPPERRNIGLVFQNYALFPHMTVADNVGFGLKMKGVARSEVESGVALALRSVHLEDYGARYPRELSGGQQQRVALARAIAPRPSVLLLDEPLSNLDLKLREAMRLELKELQQQLGMTFVYVTHDQEEAMAMSDRIVVMWQGVIAQTGGPASIYRHPASSFVADFIGKSNILTIEGTSEQEAILDLHLSGSAISLRAKRPPNRQQARFCCIRPEDIAVLNNTGDAGGCGVNRLSGTVRRVINLGPSLELAVEIDPHVVLTVLTRSSLSASLPVIGDVVALSIDPDDIQVLPE
ncbi:ABC transporter ATP-binding protein [Rhizobium leguminosarum]|uniref:ABC transporter ATP-binding protein n=1 Tax=Rhizobium leguminosarum TaxID=384 RepID=UPI001C907862|nr:ABC transporter ATP-binding protein [Rhizobium leguminosarum]MBY2919389.1 ABC transporter ATP-binding protein [Rhizobium leguminosarum]MBY2926216.1 ABC transporter ATP-binding protein [Rhizobium leguminosarum]MBY2936087.1 ABC transporter ATP-binding protein [Rhizobium leguminosarum]MBY2975038.1 ABC transporter ATP-binding protein [Rhizobium leguminosarum]MBY2982408.1 ABC transporter ATP-binding protein [Rhizobium leguminosarum]